MSSKTQRSYRLLAAVSLLALSGCVAKSAYLQSQKHGEDLDSQLAQANKQNEDLTQQVNGLTAQLSQTKQSADELAKQKSEQEQVLAGLQSEVEAGQVKITQLAGQLSINVVDKILFNSGSAKLNEAGEKVLLSVGTVLKKVSDKDIMISGHTDNVAISPQLHDKFASNWELSTARATAVARFLEEKAGLPGERLVAAGYGQYHPIADNATPEGREQNRRIELLLIPHRAVNHYAAPAPATVAVSTTTAPSAVTTAPPIGSTDTAPSSTAQ